MKIACITDDGQTISQHFGRASHYMVVTVEEGQIVDHDLREKGMHGRSGAGFGALPKGQQRGLDTDSHNLHLGMAAVIADCEALLCRGMGYGAYQSMEQANIKPVVTDVETIDEAVMTYVEGNLTDHTELLH